MWTCYKIPREHLRPLMMKLVIKNLWNSSPIEASPSPILYCRLKRLNNHLNFCNQVKYFKTARSTLYMDLLEAAEDIIDQVVVELRDDEATELVAD